jgi:acyl CoA:acetate/3-ketoacid CoA transferase
VNLGAGIPEGVASMAAEEKIADLMAFEPTVNKPA